MIPQNGDNQEHKWLICGDLKVVGLVLGIQGGYIKYPCLLCHWDSQADNQQYVRHKWPLKTLLVSVINVKEIDSKS